MRRLEEGGSEPDRRHPLYPLLHDQPNPEMTSAEFMETLSANVSLRGNGLANIVWTQGGEVSELWPLQTERTDLVRINGKLWYAVNLPNGEPKILAPKDVFHVRSFGTTGLWGLSPIDQARQSIGLGLATERYGARFFANDGTPGLQVISDKKLSDPARDRLKESIESAFAPMENKHRVMVLEDGVKAERISVAPDTAQFLESRKFQVREIARWYRIPPHLIGDLGDATFSNIDHQSLEFVKYTMLPHFRKWEQAIRRGLLSRAERETHFAKFSLEGLLRGDPQSRGEFHKALWGIGALNQDEIRALEDLNPLPDGQGQKYYVPLNMIPTDQLMGDSEPAAGGRHARAAGHPRAAEGRRRQARALEPAFRDAAVRVLRIERRDVMAAVRELLGAQDVTGFSTWMDDFYARHIETVRRGFGGAVDSLAELIAADAGENVGMPIASDRLEGFTGAYVSALGQRHVESSKGQLRAVLATQPEDLVVAVGARFDEWELKRPDRVTKRETVQVTGAVTRFVFGAAGLGSIWTAFGKSCPFCESLDGRRVSGSGAFATKDQLFEAEGREPLRLRTDVFHPPIHNGCDCGLRPG